MSEWKKYIGSDEQIAEMNAAIINSDNGILVSLRDKNTKIIYGGLYSYKFDKYLICNRHPLADMICQQARTGQPVYVKLSDIPNSMHTHFINTFSLVLARPCYSVYVTNKPDWNIPNAEYSFTSFDE